MFVLDIADDLLDQILDRHESLGPEILVEHDRKVHALLTHVGQQIERAARHRHIERFADQIGDRGGMVRWALSPSAPQRCTPGLLEGVAALSAARDLPIYTHVYETRTQRIFVRDHLAAHGGSAVRYMQATGVIGPRVTIAHGVWPEQDEIDLIGHARRVGPVLQAELRRRFEGHELVGEVRGVGMIGAVELVADRAARQNFDPALKVGVRMAALCERHGVITRVLPGDSLCFSPPLIMTEDEVGEMLDRVGRALDDLTVEVRRERLAAV